MTLLKPGANVWRVETAPRFAVFSDVASCFAAMRSSMRKARHSITIVGWDIDSRTRLVGPSGIPEDGLPADLSGFLQALVERTPSLRVNLLLWDYSAVYALEREVFPQVKLNWKNAHLCLDDALPVGSSQHQKIVIVDDSIAFNGGLDLTIRRWDNAEHLPKHPYRVDPAGKPYEPFHDVQAAVDGAAAAALADLVRERWRCAAGETLPAVEASDVWPDKVEPDFRDASVGISRTVPSPDKTGEIREVEQLFYDMIGAAEHSIYIENQYFTCCKMAEHLARRLQERPELEVLVIAPKRHDPWLEALTMRNGRIRFRQIVHAAGGTGRVRFVSSDVKAGRKSIPTMIHAKVMIVDDRIARIGSANLNNRSMGADTECDLVVEARDAGDRAAITALRSRLLAVQCGVDAAAVDRALESHSLVDASRILSGRGRSLRDIDDGEPAPKELAAYIERIGDPERPIDAETFIAMTTGDTDPGSRLRAAYALAGIAALLLVAAAGWALHTPDESIGAFIGELVSGYEPGWRTPLLMTAIFVAAGFLMVPITLLIAGTASTFGLGPGLAYAALGTLASAVVSYAIGASLGREPVRRMMGAKLQRVRDAVVKRGVWAVAAIRMVPVAPFTLVNLAAGASGVRFWPYLAGTILGMAPGFLVLSALGRQLYIFFSEPTLGGFAVTVAVVLLWVATLLATQHLAARWQGRTT